MPKPEFRSVLTSLWLRLIGAGIVGLVFAEGLILARGKVQGWTFYLTPSEVVFEVTLRVVAAGLAGIVLGTLATACVVPFLWQFSASRERIADWAAKAGVVVVVFLDSRFALRALIHWYNRGLRFEALLLAVHFVAFVVALLIRRSRLEVATSLDAFLGDKMSRRTAIATVAGAAALVTTKFALRKAAPAIGASLLPQRPKPNFLLITFDALNAEDMSLYGNRWPTTPNIDAFARTGTVFNNFYSASTFTTPSIATMMTGLYPSETHVHQLQARLRGKNAAQSLPQVMRAGGYATGAFLTNPFAYYFSKNLQNAYDVLPEPTFHPGGLQRLWEATRSLHADSGFGCRIDEYFDLEAVWNIFSGSPGNIPMRMRPQTSFEGARKVLAQLPDGFFMWVHLITPHNPYLPDPQERGRFLPPEKVATYEEEFGGRWKPHYDPDQQSLVDERRLRYDEFIATADRAFGLFISGLEAQGKLRDTTVIFSADHGESFEGGVYQHSSPYLTRPVIHVPLIIKTPGQQDGGTVNFVADQTSLAPTILELAGQRKPEWMTGRSLASLLKRNGGGRGEGLAFTQYLERNSVFKPLRHGTVGVIDGSYQYVLDIQTQKGTLRPLSEAQIWTLDRTKDNPERAKELRAAIFSRFPYLKEERP